VSRPNINLWRGLANPNVGERKLGSSAEKVLDILKTKGASFFNDIVTQTGLLKSQVEEGIGELVANGLAVSDSYSGMRALLTPESNKPSSRAPRRQRKRQALFGIEHAGRWALMFDAPDKETLEPNYETLERIIFIYLKRWGILFRSLMEKESFAPPWRVIVRVLRRMELRGQLRGGRFVSQVSGEQYALPETVDILRRIRKQAPKTELVSISAVDPLNLLGIILPGKKIANLTNNRILFRDGIPLAVWEGREVRYLKELPTEEQWEVQKILLRRKFPSRLRYYLGKNYV
jgi:ATP-dependent Lhr-like helicase